MRDERYNYNNGADYDPDLLMDRGQGYGRRTDRYDDGGRNDYRDDRPVYDSRYDPDRGEATQPQPQPRRTPRRAARNAGNEPATPRRQPAPAPAEPVKGTAATAKERRRSTPRPPKERKPFRQWGIVKFFCDKRLHAVLGVALVFAAVYIAVASISFVRSGAEDQSLVTTHTVGQMAAEGGVENVAGPVGARLAQSIIVEGFGIGSVALIVYMVLLGLSLMGLRNMSFWSLTFKTLLVGIAASLVFGLVSLWLATDYNLGGYHGQYVNMWLVAHIQWVGAALVSGFAIAAVFYVYINEIYTLLSRYRAMRRARREKQEQERYEREQDRLRVQAEMEEQDRLRDRDEGIATDTDPYGNDSGDDVMQPVAVGFETADNVTDDPYAIAGHSRYLPPQPQEMPDDTPGSIESEARHEDADERYAAEVPEIVPEIAPEIADEAADAPDSSAEVAAPPLEVETNRIETADEGRTELYDPTAELSHYCKPSVDLLRDIPQKDNIVDIDEQEENQARIRKTLNDFGIEISKVKATVGPTVTLYEIIPAEGVRIAKIKRLEDDIALQLAALGIRIIAPMPGKGTIGIEVPNKDPQTVSIRSILSSKRFLEGKEQLPMAMGATISNEVFVADLCKMPHLLVAGATGMGKSVGLNAIIASLLYKRHPAELKFVLIDPKMVEFSLYSVLERHFLAKLPDEEEAVVTQMDKVLATLNSLCTEMDNRLALLRDANVRNIAEYNEKFIQKRLMPNQGHRFMPYIVVIIDEFADLIMVAGKEVEKPVARIAQKARAVGIHMIVATQRPSTDVITGLIKNNFPGRIAFRVTQMVDSKTILDRPGANQLIGRGDMLFSHNGALTRVQCAFIDTPEVEAICHHIEAQGGYPTAYLLPEPAMEGEGGAGGMGSGSLSDRDVLFNEVAEAVVHTGVGSTTAVQRRFSIGFARAGKIMDQLEMAGIVGPAPTSGGKPRQVLVDMIALQDILRTLG